MTKYYVQLSEIRCDEGEDNTATLVSYSVSETIRDAIREALASVTDSVSTVLVTDVDDAVRHADAYSGVISL